jgi:hypothetical protein
MTNPTTGITAARRAHSARCRQRVIKALNTAVESGEEISVSAIARKALLTELKRKSPHVNGHLAVSGATVTACDWRC